MNRIRVFSFTVMVLLIVAACSNELKLALDDPINEGASIPGQYIIVLAAPELQTLAQEDFELSIASLASDLGLANQQALRVINGFVSSDISQKELRAMRTDPRIAHIEADRVVTLTTSQTNPVWGLDRIDQLDLPLDDSYSYHASGQGVTVYIVDTGIRTNHQEFGNRASGGVSIINDGRGTSDCNGHGTHVAGTVGGSLYGVAKEVKLVPVRVLNCNGSGSLSGVIAGIDWITQNHAKPAVANMSLSAGLSNALDTAVRNSVAAGITYVVAAGNHSFDACNVSPARVTEAITVGASDISDHRSSFSNFGPCVDIFAPGSSVMSAYHSSDTSAATMSGTSMASPHVAGAAALYLEGQPNATPATVMNHLYATAGINKVHDAGTGSPNRLLFVPASTQEPAPTPSEPPLEPGIRTIEARIVSSSDDAAERSSGHLASTAHRIELARNNYHGDQILGFRFTGLELPSGAYVTSAYLQFTVDQVSSEPTHLVIRGELAPDPGTFGSKWSISSRATTSNRVQWSPPAWTRIGDAGAPQRSNDLAMIVQEIINQSEWQSGNAMVFLITGSGQRFASSYDRAADKAPILYIEYILGEP